MALSPQEERIIFFEIAIRGLAHLKEQGQRLWDDIKGDGGLGMTMSAGKLAENAEQLFRLVNSHKVAKESFMCGQWAGQERDFCKRFVDLIIRYKQQVVGPLLAAGMANDKRKQSAGIKAWIKKYAPKQGGEKQTQHGYWRAGKLTDEIQEAVNDLEHIIVEADRMIIEAETRKFNGQ